MGQDYNIYEIKQIALDLEKDGFAFYMAMSKHTRAVKTRAIFFKLASDEKNHIEWINQLNIKDVNSLLSDDIGMVNDYLENVVKRGVFPNPEKVPEVIKTIKKDTDAVKIGMEAETKSVNLFSKLHKTVQDNDSKSILLKLRDQEKLHYKLLKEFLAEIDQ